MAQHFDELSDKLTGFIQAQKLFFVGTADVDGRVNISPKGGDSLRVINSRQIAWLNLTGSGNETATHMQRVNRITIMFCSFDRTPMILRLYGSGRVYHPFDARWHELSALFPSYTGARQIFEIDLDLIQTSCGFQVPYFDYAGEREALTHWADKQGRPAVERYWLEKNLVSLDGKQTGIDGTGKG